MIVKWLESPWGAGEPPKRTDQIPEIRLARKIKRTYLALILARRLALPGRKSETHKNRSKSNKP